MARPSRSLRRPDASAPVAWNGCESRDQGAVEVSAAPRCLCSYGPSVIRSRSLRRPDASAPAHQRLVLRQLRPSRSLRRPDASAPPKSSKNSGSSRPRRGLCGAPMPLLPTQQLGGVPSRGVEVSAAPDASAPLKASRGPPCGPGCRGLCGAPMPLLRTSSSVPRWPMRCRGLCGAPMPLLQEVENVRRRLPPVEVSAAPRCLCSPWMRPARRPRFLGRGLCGAPMPLLPTGRITTATAPSTSRSLRRPDASAPPVQ